MPASAASSELPPAASQLLDFTDRWPAMVVKELRQGLRSRGFVIPFLTLHGLVPAAVALEFLLTRAGTAAAGWQRMASGEPGLFWIGVYLIVAGVMPLRLMDSLQGESDGRNAELLLLGGLSRWQIVRGKWLVQAVITLLAMASLLPYVLVRYFFGGVELWQNAFSFLSVTAASLGMAGCVLGASGYPGLGRRFMVITVAGIVLGITSLTTEVMLANSRGSARLSDFALLGYVYTYAILLHGLYALIGLQLGRGHLKLFISLYEISPTRSMMALIFVAPFILLAGAIATCGWGGILILMALGYAVAVFDRTPAPAVWAKR